MKYNNEIRLIALDLDGTLTNDEKVITPRTYNALMMTQQRGVRLCLASGRPPYGMQPLAEQLEMSRYGGVVIAYNGGYVYDCQTGEVLREVFLDENLLTRLYEFQQLSGMTLMTYHGDKIYTERPDDEYVRISVRNNKMTAVGVENFVADIPRPVNKCLMVGNPDIVPEWERRMQEAFCGEMHILRSTPYFIELLPLGIDKGPALESIASRYGFLTDNIVSFGDSYNDVSMLRTSGIGVAMANADEEVKAAADMITLSNNDDGVAHVIEKLCMVE